MAVDHQSLYQNIPDKLYFKIGEVAELAGVPSYVLRFWESEFPSIQPKPTESGQRLYRKNDVEIILTIKHLLHEKRFTIESAKQHLREYIVPVETDTGAELDSHRQIDDGDAAKDFTTNNLIREVYLELQQIRDLLA